MDLPAKYLFVIFYSHWFHFYGKIITKANGIIGLPLEPDYTIEPLYYEILPGEVETIANYSSWHFENVKRTLVLNGNYSYTEDMDNTFLRGMDVYYSSSGNNKYQKLPFQLKLTPMCDFLNTSYRQYIEPFFIGKTNFPTLPPEGICPVPKGNYWVEGVTYNEENLPLHMPSGLYRLEERFYKTKPTQKMVGGLDLYGRVIAKHG